MGALIARTAGPPSTTRPKLAIRNFEKSAKTLDDKQAKVAGMEAGTWNGKIKELILEHDYLDWDD